MEGKNGVLDKLSEKAELIVTDAIAIACGGAIN
jgi:hypothetical protein